MKRKITIIEEKGLVIESRVETIPGSNTSAEEWCDNCDELKALLDRDSLTQERKGMLADEIRSWKNCLTPDNDYNKGIHKGLELAAEYIWQGVMPWKQEGTE